MTIRWVELTVVVLYMHAMVALCATIACIQCKLLMLVLYNDRVYCVSMKKAWHGCVGLECGQFVPEVLQKVGTYVNLPSQSCFDP